MRLLASALLLCAAAGTILAQSYFIKTAAGGVPPDLFFAVPSAGGPSVAVDRAGNVYFVAVPSPAIWRLDASTGLVTRVAGNGLPGYGGDGGPATSAQLMPAGIAVDSVGNLYIADAFNYRIRKVSNGVITTVAGNGSLGF